MAGAGSERDRPASPARAFTSLAGKGDTLEIVVTQAMIDEGVAEYQQHANGSDVRYVVESVFRAMAYESIAASSTNLSK